MRCWECSKILRVVALKDLTEAGTAPVCAPLPCCPAQDNVVTAPLSPAPCLFGCRSAGKLGLLCRYLEAHLGRSP
ncbi:hypothetical protein J6590_069990 [Homalodisca vitripennis]|nr:hypothetical protein J6590_069990 [Homalodisca vitripennis]